MRNEITGDDLTRRDRLLQILFLPNGFLVADASSVSAAFGPWWTAKARRSCFAAATFVVSAGVPRGGGVLTRRWHGPAMAGWIAEFSEHEAD
jgi:hypothetical protein